MNSKQLHLDNLRLIYGAIPTEVRHQPCSRQIAHSEYLELPITVKLQNSGIRMVLTALHGYISETYITEDQFGRVVPTPEKYKYYFTEKSNKPFRFAGEEIIGDFIRGLTLTEKVNFGNYSIGDPSWLRSVTLNGLEPTYPWHDNCERLKAYVSYRQEMPFWRDLIYDPPIPDVANTLPTPWGIFDAIGLVRCFTTKHSSRSWRSTLGYHTQKSFMTLSGTWKSTLRSLDPEKREWIPSHGSEAWDVGFRILFQLKKGYFKDSYITKDI